MMASGIILLLILVFGFPIEAQPLWQSLKTKVIQADLTTERGDQKRLAKEALKMTETCLKKQPEEAGCLYYRAQALGLSSRSLFGYVSRVRQMFADWEKVMQIDPTFDFGGPYRMFAEVYMELPKYFGPKDLRQNLNKAVDLLEKAIEISDYPTNWFDLAEAYERLGQKRKAQKAIKQAKTLLPKWRNHPYYPTWQGKK